MTPGRFVGTEDELDDDIPFEEKFQTLTVKLQQQFQMSDELEKKVQKSLKLVEIEKE